MLAPITIQGSHFLANGKPWAYVGVDGFGLFKRWLMPDGPNALVKPWLKEQRQIAKAGGYDGPIVVRVFRYAAPPNSFALDPWAYTDPFSQQFPKLTEFCNACGEEGFYVDLTCGDSQIVLPSQSDQQEHLNRTCAAVAGCTNVFIETCNEPFKNGIDVTQVIPPKWGPYLRDSGRYGDNTSVEFNPVLDFVSFHPKRESRDLVPWPKWLIDLNDSLATILHVLRVPAVLKEPIGFAEVAVENKRCNDPAFAYRLGHTVSYGGVLFHFDDGIDCNAPRPVQRACEEAYFAGIAGGLTRS